MIEGIKRRVVEVRDKVIPLRARSIDEFAQIVNREGGTTIQARSVITRDIDTPVGAFGISVSLGSQLATEYRSASQAGRRIVYFETYGFKHIKKEEEEDIRLQLLATAFDRAGQLKEMVSHAEVALVRSDKELGEEDLASLRKNIHEKGIQAYPRKGKQE